MAALGVPVWEVTATVDVDQVCTFIRVVDAGSFTGAARAAFRSQPTLSRHVAVLEREVGVKLLRRTPTGVELTEPGAAFLRGAKIALAELERAVAEARAAAIVAVSDLTEGVPRSA